MYIMSSIFLIAVVPPKPTTEEAAATTITATIYVITNVLMLRVRGSTFAKKRLPRERL